MKEGFFQFKPWAIITLCVINYDFFLILFKNNNLRIKKEKLGFYGNVARMADPTVKRNTSQPVEAHPRSLNRWMESRWVRKKHTSDLGRERFEEIVPLLRNVRRCTKPTTVDLYEVSAQ